MFPACRIPQKLSKTEACHVAYRENIVSFPFEPTFYILNYVKIIFKYLKNTTKKIVFEKKGFTRSKNMLNYKTDTDLMIFKYGQVTENTCVS